MGGRPNGALLKKTERKLKSPLGAPRITEQPRHHGSSVRYIRDQFNDLEGRGCNKFVPVLRGNGTKIAPTGDIFDWPPGVMS